MSMKKHYDVAIVGGGIGGIMAAYRLVTTNPALSVCIFEKGNALTGRSCPIITKKVDHCIKCKSCAIMEGMAGAGAFSDGKYVISTEYGGWLTEFLPDATVIDYIEQADEILVKFGATTERFMPNNELKKLCTQHDLHMNQAQLKHLGTDSNFDTMRKLIENLSTRCDILTNTEVLDVDKNTRVITAVDKGGEHEVTADEIIFAVGRVGSRFFVKWCEKNKIPLKNNQVDVGVRVELPALVWEDFSKKIYEPKIWYRSKGYGDTTRMFCFNERGQVVTENTDGVLTVNGHSYRDQSRKTENSNFALLSTMRFTQPFNNPIEYARHVASLANLISGGSVLVQRLGDLKLGRRTDEKRLKQSTVLPTLAAVPGDLSLCMPKRQLDNIMETLEALDKIAPGTANYDTLLYGIECKYYSARPECENFKITGCNNIYAIGDGAGFTRSLSQAAANGLYVADLLAKE
ncbi:NAD(P)/FAD-dependent oxidoreductase [Hydrogenoanaerobacterium sp.]|uniref:NAD(P)/FAD-dependent oxidoreductase n=1 Tax=Hydrogenoanaerobacterium sp. TaxID=2953763 RepID=UPI0037BE3CE7